MKIQEIMTREVAVIPPGATLIEAAQKMKSLDVGSIPVCEGNHILGMVTDRDLTIRATAEGMDPNRTTVAETMTPAVAYVFEDQDVQEAAKIMSENQIRRLPVLDQLNHLVGIVSLGDISTNVGKDKLSGQTLQDISEPDLG